VFTTARYLSLPSARYSSRPILFLKMHYNIILPSTPRSSECSLSFRFHHRNPASTCLHSHTCHMHCQSYSALEPELYVICTNHEAHHYAVFPIPLSPHPSSSDGTAQEVQRLATGWMVRGSNPFGGEVYCNPLYRLWGTPSHLYVKWVPGHFRW
jgi:hypothetical protein